MTSSLPGQQQNQNLTKQIGGTATSQSVGGQSSQAKSQGKAPAIEKPKDPKKQAEKGLESLADKYHDELEELKDRVYKDGFVVAWKVFQI